MKERNPIEKVYKAIEDSGFVFIKWLEEYKNNTSNFLLQCNINEKHKFEFCYAYLQDGLKCPYCFGRKRITIEFIREEFSKRNYTLLSNEYVNAHEKLNYICNKHPQEIQSINWNNFKSNKGCKFCGIEKQTKQQLLNQEQVFKVFKDKGLIICNGEEYKGAHKKIKCICLNHPNIGLNLSYQNISITKFPCKNCYIDAYKGENSPKWKGGTSLLHDMLRDCILEWKNKSMEYYNYRCIVTGQYFDIVHHLYNFNKIVDEVFIELGLKQLKNMSDYTQQQICDIKNALLKKHYNYGYGVPLCNQVHDLYHKLYGKYDNSEEQFKEFNKRYQLGEFNNQLEDKYKYCNIIKEVS